MDINKRIETGESIILFQEFNGKKYYLYDNEKYFSKGTKRMHRVVWEFHNGKIERGYHVHHKDGNTHNNDITNLNLIRGTLHLRFTGKKRFKDNPEFVKEFHAKGIEAAKEWHKSEEGREWHKEHGKKSWINKPYAKFNCQQCGKEFESRHKYIVKFCHNNCKAKALRARRKLLRTSI